MWMGEFQLAFHVNIYIYSRRLFFSATIASGHLDGKLRLWDVRTGNSTHVYDALHKGQITCVKVSPSKHVYYGQMEDYNLLD